MIIYKTTNVVTGLIYIGYDTKEDSNYLGSGVYYKRAERKYGKENFRKATIDSTNNFEELCLKETFWIDFYNARDPKIGYNISEGGKGGDNFTKNPHKETIREKITAATRLAMKNPEVLAKLKKPKSEETKCKMSISHKGLNVWTKGSHLSCEHKKNLSKSRIEKGSAAGKNNPMYGRTGESSPHFGKPKSEEHRRKISEALKSYRSKLNA